jgi:2-amino-4-hydroxy-6-hydroxymethyldihydropteridine diphosphokinase
MKTYDVFLGLGSNVGKRQEYLSRAVGELNRIRDTKVVWTSSVYETDPHGKTDQSRFLNAAVEIETLLNPSDLSAELQGVERQLGRSAGERWGPREIDIDILVYDGLVFEDEKVKVPHPELEKRKFALIPLREIAPDLVHPVNGMTVNELVTACEDQGRVVKSLHKLII